MKISRLLSFMSALLMIFGFVACVPAAQPPAAAPAAQPASASCVDFQSYADNTQMGMTFQVGGLTFTGLGTAEPFVNDIATNVHGLQFSNDGIQIDISGPATTVSLVAGSWTGQPLEIVALDSSGNPVDQTTVPGDSSVHSLTLSGQDITSIVIKGGGGEGVLVEICVNGTPQSTACVDFEAPLAVGNQYGGPSGQNPGDVVFTGNGIPVAVYEFIFTNGGGTFGVATIETSTATSFGQGQIANTNNINLEFDFSGLGFQPSEVTADFLDMGGFENLSVNGAPVVAGELAAAPVPAGLTISVNTTPVTGGNTGTVTITGPVKTLRIGGQEFWVDNICVKG